MTITTRPISWIKAARKGFEDFPEPVQLETIRALTVAAEGHMAEHVKPLKGFDSGVMEIVLRHRGDAFRVVYAVHNWRRFMGDSCLPEKIDAGNQNTEA